MLLFWPYKTQQIPSCGDEAGGHGHLLQLSLFSLLLLPILCRGLSGVSWQRLPDASNTPRVLLGFRKGLLPRPPSGGEKLQPRCSNCQALLPAHVGTQAAAALPPPILPGGNYRGPEALSPPLSTQDCSITGFGCIGTKGKKDARCSSDVTLTHRHYQKGGRRNGQTNQGLLRREPSLAPAEPPPATEGLQTQGPRSCPTLHIVLSEGQNC